MALSFAGSNSRVVLGSLDALSGASQLSIAGWVRLNDVNADAVIAIRGAAVSATSPWSLWRDDVGYTTGRINTLAVLVNTDVGPLRVEGSNDLLNTAGVWYHVAMVFEAGVSQGLRIYVNGAKDTYVQSTVGHSQLVANTDDATLGIDAATGWFDGSMAEMSLWDKALTDAHVARLAAGLSPLSLATEGVWPVLYQDLVRGLNRPGIGPTVTSIGSFATAAHPRVIGPRSAVTRNRSMPASSAVAPYRCKVATINTDGSQAAACFLPGVLAGATSPIGEVFN